MATFKEKFIRTIRNNVKDFRYRKSAIVFLIITMSVAAIGWLMFLVFFGRVDPIVKSTTKQNFKLYHYGLVTLPFWLFSFCAPLLYPAIALYIANGNRVLGLIAHVASISLGLILGATLNMAAAVVHVIRNLDHNTTTKNICITGLVGIVASIINLIVLMIAMPWFDRWSKNKTLQQMVGGITVSRERYFSDDDEFEHTMLRPESMYADLKGSRPPNHPIPAIYSNPGPNVAKPPIPPNLSDGPRRPPGPPRPGGPPGRPGGPPRPGPPGGPPRPGGPPGGPPRPGGPPGGPPYRPGGPPWPGGPGPPRGPPRPGGPPGPPRPGGRGGPGPPRPGGPGGPPG